MNLVEEQPIFLSDGERFVPSQTKVTVQITPDYDQDYSWDAKTASLSQVRVRNGFL